MGGRSSKNGKAPRVLNSNGHLPQNGRHRYNSNDQRIRAGGDSGAGELDHGSKSKQNELGGKPQRSEELQKQSFPYSSPANNSTDEFYDGIPLYSSSRSKSTGSRQGAVSKVSEVSSRLGRVGSVGLGKAVEVLDTLGSSMTNLNPKGGFAFAATTKGNELEILAFEVANTIVKGFNLMQSLSKRNIKRLKELLPSEGVQNLVSVNTDELLRIFAADKRDELKVFSCEVFRFGNRCKDPQWHNLDRYFEKISKEFAPQRQLQDEAESVMEVLMILVQNTAELYQELQLLDKLDQEYQRKLSEDDKPGKGQKGDGTAILRAELKSQKKEVRNLKKKSLWSRSLEEVTGKLVDVVRFLLMEIDDTFGREDSSALVESSASCHQRLGPVGLSLHYANVVLQIDDIISIIGIKDEMEKTLAWLVPMSTNTAKDHHGFGWVGEWANSASEGSRRSVSGNNDFIRIESLHHADKEKTETYILELLLWLHHLVSKSKKASSARVDASKSPPLPPLQEKPDAAESGSPLQITIEEQRTTESTGEEEGKDDGGSLETSKSEDFTITLLTTKTKLENNVGGDVQSEVNSMSA
ncbi:unnamed protein product [Linum tenue]|uniref:DUF3475 domain-containing protein n=1 Tax=Linum tenue TaxID=586396 RepID=A0AAV0KHL9_9ROSI|nr:unnamed protein product [Linum tenue]